MSLCQNAGELVACCLATECGHRSPSAGGGIASGTGGAGYREGPSRQLAGRGLSASRALAFAADNWHRGVVGIVASRLVDRFHRPVFVLSRNPEDGLAQGSGRSIRPFHLLEALESMPELFERFGGHRQAAGVTIACDKVELFRERLNAYAAARLSLADLAPQVEIDALLDFAEINERSVAEISSLGPFGCGNPPPLFAALNVEVAAPPTVWKEKHLRVPLRQNGRTLWLKAWNFARRAAELPPGARVDVAFTLEDDAYSGWSVVLRDFRPAAS